MESCPTSNYTFVPEYESLYRVQASYSKAHPTLSLLICIYGVVTNIINIVVLTKPTMRNSINCILTGIALADITTMTSYIPFVYYYYLMDANKKILSLPWTTFLAVHMNLTLISHTSSLWLGVIMAAMRYFFVRPTGGGVKNLESRSTLLIILVTFVGTTLLIIPNCLSTSIVPCYNNQTELVNWHLKQPSFGTGGNALHTLAFFVYPVGGKIIPCTLISIFGGLLLHTLRETDKRARRLKGESIQQSNSYAQNRRTTVMLLFIIALYIISELPQSILVLLCIFVDDFFVEVYNPLSDFMDLMALVNSAINFITYCTMSTQFRKTLLDTMCAWAKNSSCKKCKKDNSALGSTKYTKTPVAAV